VQSVLSHGHSWCEAVLGGSTLLQLTGQHNLKLSGEPRKPLNQRVVVNRLQDSSKLKATAVSARLERRGRETRRVEVAAAQDAQYERWPQLKQESLPDPKAPHLSKPIVFLLLLLAEIRGLKQLLQPWHSEHDCNRAAHISACSCPERLVTAPLTANLEEDDLSSLSGCGTHQALSLFLQCQ
jgi:hypothetical protein